MNARRWKITSAVLALLLVTSVAWAVQASWYGPVQTSWVRSGMASSAMTVIDDPIGRYGKGTYLSAEVKNDGAADLTDFAIDFRYQSSGNWHRIISGASWASPTATLPLVSNVTPATLAAGAESHFVVNVYGVDAVRFVASSATSTDVVIKGTFQTTPQGS